MHKTAIRFTTILMLIIGMCLILVACQKTKYPSGRDTVKSFGDGTYQIDRMYDSRQGKEIYSLYNYEIEETIENYIEYYLGIKQNIYIIGSEGYTVVNYESDEIIQETLLENIPQKHKVIFENKDDFKNLEKGYGCN